MEAGQGMLGIAAVHQVTGLDAGTVKKNNFSQSPGLTGESLEG